jgi:hypothetical protein
MESYLKGRQKTQRFHVKVPATKDSAAAALKGKAAGNEEETVRAEAAPEAGDAPDVDLVMRGGVVRRIVVHLPGGTRLELDCIYEGEEEE